MLRGEQTAEVEGAPEGSAAATCSPPVTDGAVAAAAAGGLPAVPRLRLEKLGTLAPPSLSRLSSDASSPLSPDRSKYIVNLVSPRTAFAPIRKPNASQLAMGTTAQELFPYTSSAAGPAALSSLQQRI